MKRIVLTMFVLFSVQILAQISPTDDASANPKVRAITGFVRIDQENYRSQIAEALRVLSQAKNEFEARGYDVESVRLTTQPLAELVSGMAEDQAFAFLKRIDDLSVEENFIPNVGPAMLRDNDDPAIMHLLDRVLSTLTKIQATTVIADDNGIHWKTIRRTAELVKHVAEQSPHSQGNFRFTAMAMVKPYGPFFPGSYHTGAGKQFSIGFEGANVVRDVLAKDKGNPTAAIGDLTAALTKHASVADAVGKKVAAETTWIYMGVDLTPAPLGDVSIASAIEAFTGARFGSSGTLAAANIITSAERAVPVKQVGYSGLMIAVMEDKLLAQRWAESTYNIDSALAYSAVCGTGLDTIPLPGDVAIEQIERIYGDVASLAVKWNKALSARLQPVHGKKAGDKTEFHNPYLFNTLLQALP